MCEPFFQYLLIVSLMNNTKPIRLIVGLGNPGDTYKNTRHNIGFDFLDALAEQAKISFRDEFKFNGAVARFKTDNEDIWLLKPSTFMNLSGAAVQPLASYYKISPDEILVVHDELDLTPGSMKMKFGGGNAGHNGLKDITAKLATPNFWRLRIGIGHPRDWCPAMQVYDWVLGRPEENHRKGIDACIKAALEIVELLAANKFDRAERLVSKYSKQVKPLKKPEALQSSTEENQ